MVLIAAAIILSLSIAFVAFRQTRNYLVLEDTVTVTVNRDGFVKRILPAGRHRLAPFERAGFSLETKTKLASGLTTGIATTEGIPLTLSWSGTYALEPELVKDKVSQRLRSLLHADRAIFRNVDICLRKLMGNYTWRDMYNPVTRDRLERQLNYLLADRLKPMGIVFNGLSLQTIELPEDVAEALNKARAIEMLDEVIRNVDAATLEALRGAYQFDQILRWDTYLPLPSRVALKRVAASFN